MNEAVRTQLPVNSAKVQRSFVHRASIYRTGACLFMKDFISLELKYMKILTKKYRKCCFVLMGTKDIRIILRGTYF